MLRLGVRALTVVACAWLVATGIFLFVKGLDISLVACDDSVCGDFAELAPGLASFVAGVGMLLAWPYLMAAAPERDWHMRLGIGVASGTLVVGLTVAPALALTERLGVPLWLCVALMSAIVIRPPRTAHDHAVRGRVVVGVLLAVAIVVAESVLEGDAYVLAFTMCAALTPPALSGVDDFAVGWRARALAPASVATPEELRAASEVDDAQDQENDQEDPDDAVHAASFESD
jgi:hypothetical protein